MLCKFNMAVLKKYYSEKNLPNLLAYLTLLYTLSLSSDTILTNFLVNLFTFNVRLSDPSICFINNLIYLIE